MVPRFIHIVGGVNWLRRPRPRIETMPQSFSSVTVHIVFSTKHRLPLISQEIERRLYPYIGGILRARKTPLLSIGGDKDHIHMLISLARDVSLAELIREVSNFSRGTISFMTRDIFGIEIDWHGCDRPFGALMPCCRIIQGVNPLAIFSAPLRGCSRSIRPIYQFRRRTAFPAYPAAARPAPEGRTVIAGGFSPWWERGEET